MLASRMIPALWFRLIILIAFVIYMFWEGLWVLGLIGIALMALTGWQIATAYRSRMERSE